MINTDHCARVFRGMKPDEVAFWRAVRAGRDLCAEPPTKREYVFLTKFSDRGWWNYGVTMRTGWLTPEGDAALTAMGIDRSIRADVPMADEPIDPFRPLATDGDFNDFMRWWDREFGTEEQMRERILSMFRVPPSLLVLSDEPGSPTPPSPPSQSSRD